MQQGRQDAAGEAGRTRCIAAAPICGHTRACSPAHLKLCLPSTHHLLCCMQEETEVHGFDCGCLIDMAGAGSVRARRCSFALPHILAQIQEGQGKDADEEGEEEEHQQQGRGSEEAAKEGAAGSLGSPSQERPLQLEACYASSTKVELVDGDLQGMQGADPSRYLSIGNPAGSACTALGRPPAATWPQAGAAEAAGEADAQAASGSSSSDGGSAAAGTQQAVRNSGSGR